LAAAACGDDGNGGTAGNGGTGGSGGTGGGETSTVTGVVYDDSGDTPISVAGATVTVFGTSLSATTNASGEFTLQDVPHGDVFFVSSADDHWGIVDYYYVPGETDGGIFLQVIPASEIAALATALDRTFDENDGAVNITYEGAEGGETGTISAGSDDPFTFDGDVPEVQSTVIADDEGDGDLVFTSVDPAQGPITATVTGVSGVTSCQIDQSPGTTYPIVAKSVTIVYASCMPIN